jgi:hypothetical protein
MLEQEIKPAAPAPARTLPPPAEPGWKTSADSAKSAMRAGLGLGTGGVFLILAGSSLRIDAAAIAGSFGLLCAMAVVFFAGVRALGALVRMVISKDRVGAVPMLTMIGMAAMAAFGVFTAFMGTFAMSRGRQLRRRGKVLLPPLGSDASWSALALKGGVPPEERDALAAQWRENGRTEHASVAAFARLTMDLMALGAPPSLIYAAHQDSLDEIRHTELCFSLAKALDGRDVGPGPFPEAQSARTLPGNRTLALAKLAVDSLIDGALHEGLSARVLGKLAKRCEEPDARALLLELAADEGRHSAHGWDAVAWCLKEGGAPVAYALRAAAATLSEHPPTELPPQAQDGSWEAYGIHGAALEKEQHALARAAVMTRVDRLTRAAA